MIRNLLALTGLISIALVSAVGLQAYFDEDTDPPRARVSYVGLDLTSPEGLRILERRVNAAIDDVCGRYEARELWRRRGLRDCREDAIAGVTPQIEYAVDRARRNRATVLAEEDMAPAPGRYDPPPPPPPVDAPPLRLVKRTVVTTRTVTTTRSGSPPPLAATRSAWHPRPAARRLPPRGKTYHRLPEQPGSWLPPAAWRAIDGAIVRAFRTGQTTPWSVADRRGYVTVSDKRWIDGCVCRNVRSVKYSDRQIVVAQGMKCLPRGR